LPDPEQRNGVELLPDIAAPKPTPFPLWFRSGDKKDGLPVGGRGEPPGVFFIPKWAVPRELSRVPILSNERVLCTQDSVCRIRIPT